MGVRDHDAEQAVVPLAETRDLGEQGFSRLLVVGRIEGQADIEHQALPSCLDLDAGAADFPRASMDANPHECSPR